MIIVKMLRTKLKFNLDLNLNKFKILQIITLKYIEIN